MLFRFSLYGFLKNQRYFEPFLVLAFLDKGLSFFAIGTLIAFREITTNVLEIPSGSIADLLGRRRSMLVSFTAYLASFLVFWLADDALLLWPAMAMFSVGEAFRTGTHKAMIFAWLAREGRANEKTKVYGHTRSWSKLGSAASIVVGASLLFWLDDYSAVFLLSAIPTAVNLVNLATYPAYLDGERQRGVGLRQIFRHSTAAITDSLRKPALRRLLSESMAFEGVFHAAKDFLQPLLAACSVVLFAHYGGGEEWSAVQRSTLLIAPIYLVLHLLSAFASRHAHRVVTAVGGDESRAARILWASATAVFAAMLIGELTATFAVTITAFVLLHVVQNVWRPILLSRLDTATDGSSAVTLSVESQARRTATMLLAPLFGIAIDTTQANADGQVGNYWPIAVVGAVLAMLMWLRSHLAHKRVA